MDSRPVPQSPLEAAGDRAPARELERPEAQRPLVPARVAARAVAEAVAHGPGVKRRGGGGRASRRQGQSGKWHDGQAAKPQ